MKRGHKVFFLKSFYENHRNLKNLKTLKIHEEKMSIRVNICMSKIQRTPIKVDVLHMRCAPIVEP